MAQLPPPGWHPDPLGRNAQRYWDGQQWTEHAADAAGNMTVDPIAGAGGQQAGAGQAGSTQQQTGAQGQQAFGSTQQGAAPADAGAQAGASSAHEWPSAAGAGVASTAAARDAAVASHQDTATPHDTSGQVPTWGEATTGGGATTSDTVPTADTTPAAGTATPGSDTAAQDTGAATAQVGFADVADTSGAVADQGGLVAIRITADDTAVATADAVVAREAMVAVSEDERGHLLTGTGTVWLGGDGRHVTVVNVPDSGLIVGTGNILAHSAALEQSETHSGITGFDATRLTGAGWVAVAAEGGIAEVATDHGLAVRTAAVVAYSADLDIAHGEDVELTGDGIALVAAGG